MLSRNLTIGLLGVFLLATSSAHAAQPEDSQSFWNRWFVPSEKVEVKDEVKEYAKQEKHKDKSSKRKDNERRYFSDSERSEILDYYRYGDDGKHKKSKGKKNKKHKNLPHGLQKKLARGGQLPPGWQKKVARGEVLDADILRQSEYMPAEPI